MKKTTIYRRIAFLAAMALLILLISFQILPLTYNEANLIEQAGLQSTRAQRLAKDVLILEYRPASAHVQAISEIQNTLPLWESEQTQLEQTHNTDMQTLLDQTQPDYTAIDTAARKLLINPSDITQDQIILQHERNYTLMMSQNTTLIQSRVQSVNVNLVIIQGIISVLVGGTIIVLFIISRQQSRKESI